MSKPPHHENNNGQKGEPQDGFDLIDYPCAFNFKAMCRADPEQAATDYIKALILSVMTPDTLLKIRSHRSRTGKFESVTATVTLLNREQLELVYKTIADAERVVMTL